MHTAVLCLLSFLPLALLHSSKLYDGGWLSSPDFGLIPNSRHSPVLAASQYPMHPPQPTWSQVNEGLVLAVGPGRRNKDGDLIPVGVKEGDKVLLPEYGGSQIKLDNKE